jgi:hypothetical protein
VPVEDSKERPAGRAEQHRVGRGGDPSGAERNQWRAREGRGAAVVARRGLADPLGATASRLPVRYPILDKRALHALGVRAPATYSFRFWEAYVAEYRKLLEQAGVDGRTSDRGVWHGQGSRVCLCTDSGGGEGRMLAEVLVYRPGAAARWAVVRRTRAAMATEKRPRDLERYRAARRPQRHGGGRGLRLRLARWRCRGADSHTGQVGLRALLSLEVEDRHAARRHQLGVRGALARAD